MKILGISALYHDSAAALLVNGRPAAAAQEERFTRKKHDDAFPINAIDYCLRAGGIKLSELDAVAFYDKPFLKFERLLTTYLATAPRGFASFRLALPLWIKEKLFQKQLIIGQLTRIDPSFDWDKKLLFSEHHLSHAASAFYPSPFPEAAILTMDGVGEWSTTSLAAGRGASLDILQEIHFPHSLGLLYSAFTFFTGFRVNSGEYKLMGLAPYGTPRFRDLILRELIDLKADGSFRLNQEYFDYCTGLTMTNERFALLFGMPARRPDAPLTAAHMDLAASVQAVTEEAVIRLARTAVKETGLREICLAGGVALNCVANGKLLRSGVVDSVWVQPAAGDAGGALGAALAAHHLHFGKPRASATGRDGMRGSYLGPEYSQAEAEQGLRDAGAVFRVLPDDALFAATAAALSEGKAVGWMQGRMEFGPRALGARSILADPRSRTMQSQLNLKVKYRESFRPFAPAVLREKVSEWFEIETDSPYMLLVADVVKKRRREMTTMEQQLSGIEKLNVPRSEIPAVTHVDYSARVQTVDFETNPRFHSLLREFEKLTGCPVLVNTSFNVRGEPIVERPGDAYRCFMGTEIEVLVVGNCFLRKEEQPIARKLDYKNRFDLD
ncbi:MAG: carbamoyltransferase family protein [Bdellovibrionota bacterium]